MKSIFALYSNFQQAEAASRELLAGGFKEGEMNAVVLVKSAKEYMDEVDFHKISVERTLSDFDIPDRTAETYRDGVSSGGVLFWVRAGDEKAAQAVPVFEAYKGKHIVSVP